MEEKGVLFPDTSFPCCSPPLHLPGSQRTKQAANRPVLLAWGLLPTPLLASGPQRVHDKCLLWLLKELSLAQLMWPAPSLSTLPHCPETAHTQAAPRWLRGLPLTWSHPMLLLLQAHLHRPISRAGPCPLGFLPSGANELPLHQSVSLPPLLPTPTSSSDTQGCLHEGSVWMRETQGRSLAWELETKVFLSLPLDKFFSPSLSLPATLLLMGDTA